MEKNIHGAVCKCLHDCPPVEELIDELNRLISIEGASCCQAILQLLASIEIPLEQAEMYWQELLDHRREMSLSIGRPISLQTASCDFFSSIRKEIKQPKVIEMKVFEAMVRQCHHDFLTGLNNRAAVDNMLEKEIARAKRYHREISLLFLDLDDFKRINDTFGHQAGDTVLQEVGAIIEQEKRPEDTAGRYGGEEFVVILPDTSKLDALFFAERVRGKIENLEVPFADQAIHVTVSGGLASWPDDASSKMSLIACADQAHYKAKSDGKNLISLFGVEKRRYLRIDFARRLEVKILRSASDMTTVSGINISLGGVLFESEKQIATGTFLELTASFDDDKPLVFQGQVRRVERLADDKYEIGVSFSRQDKTTTHALATYINRYLDHCGKSCPITEHALQAI
ncbi:MAG: diguanylate cyclase [Desulfobulbaceae bacterium]|jgi:diguanylate cyclase (GGDEF)-like protein|nr:diguanylate cyclase [Desulfobulbaceae bacterium]